MKRPETSWLHVLWRKGRTCSCSISFSLSLIFSLVAANIFHFLTAATKFHVVPPTKNVSFVFFPLVLFPFQLCWPVALLSLFLWALSIKPKIPVISVATSNGTDHGLTLTLHQMERNGPGPTGIFGTNFEGGPL